MRTIDNAIIRFSGDSGDGMQLVGTLFSSTSAVMGNDISTFPDYPSEIRAPSGTIAGVSGFQVNIGSLPVLTPGDEPDILVAMNPAALKANLSSIKKGGVIVLNSDAFDSVGLSKAGYSENPIGTKELADYQVIEAPITTQTLEILKESSLEQKAKLRCKNFYALGIIYFMYGRDLDITINWLKTTFKDRHELFSANVSVLKAGHNFGETLEASISTFRVSKAKLEPGRYRHINGNSAVAYGLMQAAECAGLPLFLGSYPITPASEILHELSKYKQLGVKTFQAEDEISAICASIGAAYGGALAVTTTSGPGLSLKSEALGLALMMELPLVIVDVQRGGPSTGLPTKSEQSDLNLAMYGRHGEAPLVILAASSPKDCFYMAFEAARLALLHMSPVILLTDGYIANGAEAWKIPYEGEFPPIPTRLITPQEGDDPANFQSYLRDPITLSRPWAVPGMKGYEHRIGGLEKRETTGGVCYDGANHERMGMLREEKVNRISAHIPLQEIEGERSGNLLVVSWGGTYGATHLAVKQLRQEGVCVSLVHLKYLNPFPQNLEEIFKGFKKILVAEINFGQLKNILNYKYACNAIGFNVMQARPFKVSELVTAIKEHAGNNL
ncbi:MAG: 2-oxoacid:acceptor oxidoreductase subunit alpha [Oligoflexia bacterium]|nr:2-oxoacid:acceptor oxidoreductase subunit alpha [Oligoflexia bacterium]MBF0364963.1 2-oxoacid:acceptor oxidoreductase subunit alpha [Oligoflexia bacterium]